MSYPLVPPPLNDIGAWTWPRTLQRWLDVNPVTRLTRTSTYITLPAFTTPNVWNGYSDIVASFNCESPNNFSFVGISLDTPTSPNYTLCVSYRVNNNVTRYALWIANGAVMNQTIPLYTGQPLLKNFRFEIWNTSQGATSQTTPIIFYTSMLGKQDYRYASDGTLVSLDSENTNFACVIPGSNSPINWASLYDIQNLASGIIPNNVDGSQMNLMFGGYYGTNNTINGSGFNYEQMLYACDLSRITVINSVTIGHYGGGSTVNYRLSVTPTQLLINRDSGALMLTLNYNITAQIVYVSWSFGAGTSNPIVSLYDRNGNQIATGTYKDTQTNFSDYTLGSNNPSIAVTGKNSFLQLGFPVAPMTEQQAVQSMMFHNGWLLPMTFPSTSVSTTN